MAGELPAISGDEHGESVVLPRPTVAPLVLALGMTLLAAGVILSVAFVVVGAAVLVSGLGLWVAQLLPGRGHVHEPLVSPSMRPLPVEPTLGGVARMQEGMPGYRLRLPTEVHPISAGLKGGLAGGLLMPIPALLWGLLSGHGIWYPVNLLAGMVLPGVDRMAVAELEQLRPTLLAIGLVIHILNSATFGAIYGVLLPTLPNLPQPLAWGGLLIPMLWTAASYALLGRADPLLARGVDWPWFIASQFVFGVVAAMVVARFAGRPRLDSGLLAGVAGGLVMPIPALAWGWLSGHGIWYPANLLAAMVHPSMASLPRAELEAFRPGWLGTAFAIHTVMSLAIGVVFGLVLPRLRPIPSTMAWGGLLLPLIWTAVSFALMGVVNPILQRRVDWPWFIASQFVFGVTAAIVVHRSERIFIPPAGQGPDSLTEFAVGPEGGRP